LQAQILFSELKFLFVGASDRW
jgi:hypothetical protein